MILMFDGIPESDIVVFSDAVLMTLGFLGVEVEFDETSPPDDVDEVTYKVYTLEEIPEILP